MEVVRLRDFVGVSRSGGKFVFLSVLAVVLVAGGFALSYVVGGHSDLAAYQKPPQNESSSGSTPGIERPVTESGESPFVAVVDKTYDAVVNITANRRYRTRYHDMYDEFWRRFFSLPPREQVIPSFGSGFIVSSDGYIVTNNHVVDGSEDITVTLADRTTHKAEIVGADQPTDVAVLKIYPEDPLQPISFGASADLKIGDWVVAIGNPFPSLGLDRSVTVGVVSGKGRSRLAFGSGTPVYQDYIQTDASINPGNSGGPLLNLRGEVIGVNSAIASPSGGSVGIGFAIPADLARQIVDEIISFGKVTRGYLGVVPRDVTQDEAEMVGLDKVTGVYIAEVSEGSPADRAGVKLDDIVVSFNGEEVAGEQDFRLKVASASQGAEVELGLIRKGKRLEIPVMLGDRDEALAQVYESPPDQGTSGASNDQVENTASWLGMTVADCSEQLAYKFGVYYHKGAMVLEVEDGSPADLKGIIPGTIIVEINYVSIEGKEDFRKVASELKDRKRAIAFHVFDTAGRIGYVAIKPR